jgi:hypothetical protein
MARRVERSDIVHYRAWGERRAAERSTILEKKQVRRIHVGEFLTFLFENTDTVRYQIQEMMCTEEIADEGAIAVEIDVYNELLGGPGELGCVLLVEIVSDVERAVRLVEWLDLLDFLYAELEDGTKIRPRYDPHRTGDERLLGVQYLVFPTGGRVPVALGSDHRTLRERTVLDGAQRAALGEDLRG